MRRIRCRHHLRQHARHGGGSPGLRRRPPNCRSCATSHPPGGSAPSSVSCRGRLRRGPKVRSGACQLVLTRRSQRRCQTARCRRAHAATSFRWGRSFSRRPQSALRAGPAARRVTSSWSSSPIPTTFLGRDGGRPFCSASGSIPTRILRRLSGTTASTRMRIDGLRRISDFVHPAWFEPWRNAEERAVRSGAKSSRALSKFPKGAALNSSIRALCEVDEANWGGQVTPRLNVYGVKDRGGSRLGLRTTGRGNWAKSER